MLFLVKSNRVLPKIACGALNYCQIRVVTARTGVSESLLPAPSTAIEKMNRKTGSGAGGFCTELNLWR